MAKTAKSEASNELHRRFEFEIVGMSPLLLHVDDVEKADMLSAWRKDSTNARAFKAPGDDRMPPWTWQTYTPVHDHKIVVPSEYLLVALRQAGSQVTLKGMKTFKTSAVAGVHFEQPYVPLLVDGKPIPTESIEKLSQHPPEAPFPMQMEVARSLGFELFSKRAAVGTAKHIRVRPKFDKWSLRGTLVVALPELDEARLTELFDIAGVRMGIGDWRPSAKQSPGAYGRFSAKIKQIK